MWYCGKNVKKNLTIGQIEIKTGEFLIVREKMLSGLVGKILHKYLRLNQTPNHCRHVAIDSFGIKLENGSYSGAIKLLKEQKIDWFGRIEPLYNLNENFFTISQGSFEDGFFSGHIFKPILSNDQTDCLKMFDIELYLILFAFFAFLITLFVTYKFLPKSNLSNKIELISKNLLELDFSLIKGIDPISIFLLFYTIYFFIFKNILSNNIKSNQVVVDTTDLVMNRDDLENTKRTICYWRDNFEYKIISTALNGSYLNRIFNKSKNKCTYSSDPQSFLEQKVNFDKGVLLLNLQNLFGIGSWLSKLPYVNNRYHFVSKEPLFKVLSTHAFKKNIDPYFTKVSFLETELGFQQLINEQIASTFAATYEYRVRLFRSKSAYVDEFTFSEDLGIEYFEVFFQIYFILNFSNLIIFLIYLMIINLKKNIKNLF